ncbi:MAG: baeRF10 domain-containing protein [bacterium JZ-2024 1]
MKENEIARVGKNLLKQWIPSEQREVYRDDIEAVLNAIEQTVFEERKRGIAVFSCVRNNFLRIFPVPANFRFTFRPAKQPYLVPMHILLHQQPEVGCLIIDQKKAWIGEYFLGETEEIETLTGSIPRKVKDFGFEGRDELRMTRRVEEHLLQFSRIVAERISQLAGVRKWDYLLLFGREKMMFPLRDALPKPWQERIIEMVKIEPDAVKKIGKICESTIENFLFKRVEQVVEQVMKESAAGQKGRIGLAPVISALNEGSVQSLVLSPEYVAPGYVCPGCFALSDRPGLCPYCSSPLREEKDIIPFVIEKAHRLNAQVLFVTNRLWEKNASIGCLLRFSPTPQ